MFYNPRRLRPVAVLLLCMFLLTGCGGGAVKPDAVVHSFLTALQNAEYESAAALLDTEESEAIFLEALTAEHADTLQRDVLDAIVDSIEFEDVSVKSMDDNKAVVKATVTVLDCVSIITLVVNQATGMVINGTMQPVEGGEDPVTTAIDAMIVDALSAENAPIVKKDIQFTLTKDADGQWKIVASDVMVKGLTGGLLKAFE